MSSTDAFEALGHIVSSDMSDQNAARFAAGHLLARLKAANRAANDASRNARARSADARLAMDNTHLGRQNLLYQRRHVESEIEKCRQFASIYEDIPLHTREEFERFAPENASHAVDDHQLMLSRLGFELSERQRLDARRRELTARRDALLKSVKHQQEKLDAVSLQFDALAKQAIELQNLLQAAPTGDSQQ
ncbi:THO complex, subunit 5 [Auriculariales sp. MPI-PUGE-AT-0066]|nr:THO complex, subunit 5 [Auriculariales sp. MPI-PUGE-AT-0066]